MKKVEYSNDLNVAFFDGYKFRKDRKTGYYLATKPTDGKHRERLHCYVWRYFNGPIPEGFHVHHINEDKGNNDIENLCCIPGRLHTKYHSIEYAENHYGSVIENLNKNVRPKASEWHKSEIGKAWHSKQAKINAQNMELRKFVCEYCGKEFYRKPTGQNKFCSNKCKSAYRRKLGVDNETRICKVCGREFITNKYSSGKCCSRKCAGVFHWNKKNQAMWEAAGL